MFSKQTPLFLLHCSVTGPNITFMANCSLAGSANAASNVVGWCGYGLSATGMMVGVTRVSPSWYNRLNV